MTLPIDPRVDFAFKKVLSVKPLLLDFVANVFKEENIVVRDITFVNPFNDRDYAIDKMTIVDIKVLDDLGRTIQVEIQLTTNPWTPARIAYTWAMNYSKSLQKSQGYEELKPCFAIWVLSKPLFDDDQPHHTFKLVDVQNDLELTSQLGIHTLELSKCPFEGKIDTGLDLWMYFFEHGGEYDPSKPPAIFQDSILWEAFKVLQEISEEDRSRHIYLSRLDQEREAATIQRALQRAEEKAEAERQSAAAERQNAAAERQSAAVERQRADTAEQNAAAERQRADAVEQKAEAERQRADAVLQALKLLVANPDGLSPEEIKRLLQS